MKVESKEEATEISKKYGQVMPINWRKKLQSYIVDHLQSLEIPDEKIEEWNSHLHPGLTTQKAENSGEMKTFPDTPVGVKQRDLLIACGIVMASFGVLWLRINSASSPLERLEPKVELMEKKVDKDIEVRKRLFELKYKDHVADSLIYYNSTDDEVYKSTEKKD